MFSMPSSHGHTSAKCNKKEVCVLDHTIVELVRKHCKLHLHVLTVWETAAKYSKCPVSLAFISKKEKKNIYNNKIQTASQPLRIPPHTQHFSSLPLNKTPYTPYNSPSTYSTHKLKHGLTYAKVLTT